MKKALLTGIAALFLNTGCAGVQKDSRVSNNQLIREDLSNEQIEERLREIFKPVGCVGIGYNANGDVATNMANGNYVESDCFAKNTRTRLDNSTNQLYFQTANGTRFCVVMHGRYEFKSKDSKRQIVEEINR